MPSVTVPSGTPILVVPANTQRLSLVISNLGNSFIYLGPDSTVTSQTGIAVDSGSSYYEDDGGQRTYLGDYYATSETSTNTASYWERVR